MDVTGDILRQGGQKSQFLQRVVVVSSSSSSSGSVLQLSHYQQYCSTTLSSKQLVLPLFYRNTELHTSGGKLVNFVLSLAGAMLRLR